MIICVCNNINEKLLEELVEQKELTCLSQVQKEISICNQCKSCASSINDIIICAKFKREEV